MSRTGLNKAECCRDRAEWSSESRLRAVEPIVVRDRAESIHSSAMSVNVNVHKIQLRHFVTFIIYNRNGQLTTQCLLKCAFKAVLRIRNGIRIQRIRIILPDPDPDLKCPPSYLIRIVATELLIPLE